MDGKQGPVGDRADRGTNDDMPDLGRENTFEQCVSEMAVGGFTGSEVGNKYPKDPAKLKRALDLRASAFANQCSAVS